MRPGLKRFAISPRPSGRGGVPEPGLGGAGGRASPGRREGARAGAALRVAARGPARDPEGAGSDGAAGFADVWAERVAEHLAGAV